MNIRSRAYRILNKIGNYTSCENTGESFECSRSDLGDIIGYYEDKKSGAGRLDFMEYGLRWLVSGKQVTLKYSDISGVFIPEEKEKRILTIETKTGEELVLPITGGEGKFRDSMEVSRFLDRVVSDLERLTKPT